MRALLVGLKTLRPDQMAALMALGLIEEAAFRPNLGGLALDLGIARFDAILRARQAEFLASIGFEG